MKVAVVGAGIGGLCLAQALRRAGTDVTVYERDETLDSRGQGYRLHLDAGTALHACLPPDLYELCVATSGRPSTAMTVMTERLRPLRRTEIKPPAEPLDPAALSTSVNRRTFREILAARLDGVLEFGRGIVCLYGRTALTGLPRPLVPPATWDGFTAVVGSAAGLATGVLDFRERPERAARRLVPDVHLSPARSYLMWALSGSACHFTGRLGGLDPAALHAVVLNTIRRWHPDLVRLVQLASIQETSLAAVRSAVPIALWPASRVTLLGDAIHAMSPARGSGANTALRDAALLATELGAAARDEKTPVQAIADYERQMVDYGFAAVRASRSAELAATTRRGAVLRYLVSHLPAPR